MKFISCTGYLLNHILPPPRQAPGSVCSWRSGRRNGASTGRCRAQAAAVEPLEHPAASPPAFARSAAARAAESAVGSRRTNAAALCFVRPEPLAPELFKLADELGIDLPLRGRRVGGGVDRLGRLLAGDAVGPLREIPLACGRRLTLRRDVEAPAREPRCKAHVLSVASDRQRELIVGNDHQCHAVVLEELDPDYLRGSECV